MTIVRRLRLALRRGPQNERPFVALQENFLRCQTGVKLFYLVSIVIAFTMMPMLRSEVEGAQDLDLLWPVFWKIGSGVVMLMEGREGNFSPRGLALTLADRMVQTGTEPLLARLVIENYYISWALFLGLIYAQFVAVVIVFRPRLHVIWGLILVGFHSGTWLLMEISNVQHLMVLILLMVMSPFAKDWQSWETLGDLPLFGGLFRIRKMRRETPVLAGQAA